MSVASWTLSGSIFLSDAFFPESSPYGIINLTGSGGNGMHISLNIPEKGKVQVSPQHPYRTFFFLQIFKTSCEQWHMFCGYTYETYEMNNEAKGVVIIRRKCFFPSL